MRTDFQRRTLAAVGALLLTVQTASACINDRDSDTLALQAKGLPDTVSVITGRFPRSPALFYEMRIQRVAKELSAHPEQLRLYDDIAAAYDRLGKDDDAITWIEKKHRRLGKTSPVSPAFHEDWYRYYANVGTFRAHRWIRAGANPKQKAELRQARAEIAKAIHIKPDAHFGREKYQLAVMDWLLNHRNKPLILSLPRQNSDDATEAIKGISGLVVLGGAWESPDVFAALSAQLAYAGRLEFGHLALLRCQELLDSGKKSLFAPDARTAASLVAIHFRAQNTDALSTKYRELRNEAETWQNARWKYLLVRLHQGRHPDTDPQFWNEWKETPAPSLVVAEPWSLKRFLNPQTAGPLFFVFAAALVVLVFALQRPFRCLKARFLTRE